jgi:hypothetical protein
VVGNSKRTSYLKTYLSGLTSIILAPLPLTLEEPSTYNFQKRIIRCYFIGTSNIVEEVVIKCGDLDVFIEPLKEHSTMKSTKV